MNLCNYANLVYFVMYKAIVLTGKAPGTLELLLEQLGGNTNSLTANPYERKKIIEIHRTLELDDMLCNLKQFLL